MIMGVVTNLKEDKVKKKFEKYKSVLKTLPESQNDDRISLSSDLARTFNSQQTLERLHYSLYLFGFGSHLTRALCKLVIFNTWFSTIEVLPD